jgi:RecA/RadA recombinase
MHLDDLLGGGLETAAITQFYGLPTAGNTLLLEHHIKYSNPEAHKKAILALLEIRGLK